MAFFTCFKMNTYMCMIFFFQYCRRTISFFSLSRTLFLFTFPQYFLIHAGFWIHNISIAIKVYIPCVSRMHQRVFYIHPEFCTIYQQYASTGFFNQIHADTIFHSDAFRRADNSIWILISFAHLICTYILSISTSNAH